MIRLFIFLALSFLGIYASLEGCARIFPKNGYVDSPTNEAWIHIPINNPQIREFVSNLEYELYLNDASLEKVMQPSWRLHISLLFFSYDRDKKRSYFDYADVNRMKEALVKVAEEVHEALTKIPLQVGMLFNGITYQISDTVALLVGEDTKIVLDGVANFANQTFHNYDFNHTNLYMKHPHITILDFHGQNLTDFNQTMIDEVVQKHAKKLNIDPFFAEALTIGVYDYEKPDMATPTKYLVEVGLQNC